MLFFLFSFVVGTPREILMVICWQTAHKNTGGRRGQAANEIYLKSGGLMFEPDLHRGNKVEENFDVGKI